MRMKIYIFLFIGVLGLSIQGFTQDKLQGKIQEEIVLSPEQQLLLKQRFKQVKIVRIDLPALYQLSHSKKTDIPVSLSDGKHSWNMRIEENEIRSTDYKQEITTDSGRFEIPRDACGTFKGYEISDPESWVRMNIRAHSFSALIHTHHETHYAELLKKFIAGVDENWVMIYTRDDVVPTDASCGGGTMLNEIEQNRQRIQPKINRTTGSENENLLLQGTTQSNASGTTNSANSTFLPMLSTPAANCRKLEIVTDSDYDNYNSSFGLQVTNSEILDNLNNVEPIFLGQYGIKFVIRYQHEWTTASDPYSISLVCDDNVYDRLDQFRDYWNNTSHWFYNHLARDLAILYSGINFDGGTVGCAFTGSINLTYNGHISDQYMIVQTNTYGTFGAFNWSTSDFTSLTAHEIGHIMGSSHVSSPANLMAPTLSGNTNWASQSIGEINNLLGSNNTKNRLSSRYIIIPFTTSTFGGFFNGGEVYIKSSVSNSGLLPLNFEGVDHCTVEGTSSVSSSNIGGVTIKTAPCNNGGF
jgi:hypothetical protein